MELFPTVYRENCIISQKLPDSGTQMGTMESLPQEFHQVTACNAKHKYIKDAAADAKPLRGQTKISQPLSVITSSQESPPNIDKAHQEGAITTAFNVWSRNLHYMRLLYTWCLLRYLSKFSKQNRLFSQRPQLVHFTENESIVKANQSPNTASRWLELNTVTFAKKSTFMLRTVLMALWRKAGV